MRSPRIALALVVFALTAGAGWMAARPLAPERLRQDLEERLAEALGGEVRIPDLRFAPGFGVSLEANGVEAWPGPGKPGLRAHRVSADLRVFAHLTGQRRLRRLRLEGVELRLVRDASGRWSPSKLAELLASERPAEQGEHNPEELLRPLIALELASRALLSPSPVADRLEIVGGRVVFDDALADAEQVGLEAVRARITRRPFVGDVRLEARADLYDAEGRRGRIEWNGHHGRSGELRVAWAATDLDLSALAPLVRWLRPGALLTGSLSGAVVFEAEEPGHGSLEIDLVGREIHSATGGSLGPLDAERVALRGSLRTTPDLVRVEDARLESDALGLELDGVVERPLQGSSRAQLALAVHDVSLAEVRHLMGWLPDIEREEAEAVLAPLEFGRLDLLRTGGSATLAGWQDFLAGRSRVVPEAFVLDAHLAETTLRVGESDRISELSGRLWWTGDRMEVREARAQLNGKPLPTLDLSVEGMGHLYAASPENRMLASGAEPLVGLRPLWQVVTGDPGEDPALTRVSLEFQHLEHPMFLWPIEDARAVIEPLARGVRIQIPRGLWAGVPVEGGADWTFEPDERVQARLTASAPDPERGRREEQDSWASGHFAVGAILDGDWRHESAGGRFDAIGGILRLHDAEIAMLPSGWARASARLDLSRPRAVPFDLSFAVDGGDVSSIGKTLGLPEDLASGDIDMAGSFRGSLEPEVSLSKTLDGLLDVRARNGTIRHAVPAVVAIALASEMFNPFAKRDVVRYEIIETLLEFRDGAMSSESFDMDGPDVRAFATGSIGISRSPTPLDVEVALFLFRPVDSVIGWIPIVNTILLGPNRNLMAAHMELDGTWQDPEARMVPLRSIASGPGSLVFETFPTLVQRGIRLLDGWFSSDDLPPEPAPEPAAPAPSES